MIGEIISIGDELASGQRLDTNSQWLSDQLGTLGVRVLYHSTVADDMEANLRVFRTAVERADLVIVTGGLGPTADDLTRDVLAELCGRELVLDEPSLKHIESLFARYKRDMPERNRAQALHPAGSRVLFNPNGTAPGIWIEIARPGAEMCHIFAMPGVPAEMFEMYKNSVAPAVRELLGKPGVIAHRRIKCFGAGESHVERMLPDLIRRGRQPSVGITVHDATITLRITAEGCSREECLAAIAPTEATIRECLGSLVFGDEGDELEHAVVRLLNQQGLTLSTLETNTGGRVATWLADSSGGSSAFAGGEVVADPLRLGEYLGISAGLLSTCGPASREVVEALAVAWRQRRGTSLALVIGRFPADRATNPDSPFHFAVSTPEKCLVKASSLVGHPSIWRGRAGKLALNLLRLHLLGEM